MVNPGGLLPADRGYWTYTGSLTTPPCTEGVRWFVFEQQVTLSRDQLRAFQSIYKMNTRQCRTCTAGGSRRTSKTAIRRQDQGSGSAIQCFFAGAALAAAKLTFGGSARVTCGLHGVLAAAFATSFWPSAILPSAIAASAVQRSKRASAAERCSTGNRAVPPLEVQRAFGRAGKIFAGVAGELDLAVGIESAAPPGLAEHLADSGRVELLEAAFSS